jgi:hypothetical protein
MHQSSGFTCNGESISIDPAEVWVFLAVARELENKELISHCFNVDSISVRNAVNRLAFFPWISILNLRARSFVPLIFHRLRLALRFFCFRTGG